MVVLTVIDLDCIEVPLRPTYRAAMRRHSNYVSVLCYYVFKNEHQFPAPFLTHLWAMTVILRGLAAAIS